MNYVQMLIIQTIFKQVKGGGPQSAWASKISSIAKVHFAFSLHQQYANRIHLKKWTLLETFAF